MRLVLGSIAAAVIICAPSDAADRHSWNKIHYVGGTVPIQTSPFDFDTSLTIIASPAAVVLRISPAKLFAPEQTVRIQSSQVISLSCGPAAWRLVAEVNGAQLPAKPHSLFGLGEYASYLGIVYEGDDGKRRGILLDSLFVWQIVPALAKLTGKPVERWP